MQNTLNHLKEINYNLRKEIRYTCVQIKIKYQPLLSLLWYVYWMHILSNFLNLLINHKLMYHQIVILFITFNVCKLILNRQRMGEELDGMDVKDLRGLEQNLDEALKLVRHRKVIISYISSYNFLKTMC